MDANRSIVTQPVRRREGLWGDICSIRNMDKGAERMIVNGIHILIGDGCNTLFWEDLWLGEFSLKDKFSRLFSVSLQKNSLVSNFRFRDGAVWN